MLCAVKCGTLQTVAQKGGALKVRRLAQCRTDAFLTQEALAARSGVSRDTISRLESGERVNAHAKTVAKLAEALGVRPIEITGASSLDELHERHSLGDGQSESGLLGWRKRKRAGLNITETERAELALAYRRTLDEILPEDTPAEAYMTLEWMALVFQEYGYEEAKRRAESRVYSSGEDF